MPAEPTAQDPVAAATERAVQDVLRRQAAMVRANADPLPGPLLEAFALRSPDLVRQVVAGDFMLFKQLNSPMHRQRLALADYFRRRNSTEPYLEPPKTPLTNEDGILLAGQFLVPAAQAAAWLARGLPYFRTAASRAVQERFGPAASGLQDFLTAIELAVLLAFDTSVEFETPSDDGKTEIVFGGMENAARDGLGWWLAYVARLCRDYGWPLQYVVWELPFCQGLAFVASAIESNPLLRTCRKSPGYVSREIEHLLES